MSYTYDKESRLKRGAISRQFDSSWVINVVCLFDPRW